MPLSSKAGNKSVHSLIDGQIMLDALGRHRQKLGLIFGLWWGSLVAALWIGNAKRQSAIDWLDVLGEGGSAAALAVWMLLILASRPAGRITNWLTLGLGFMFLAFWLDALDEFLRLPATTLWPAWFESVAMPVGIALLTYGLYHWHREQLAINRQLRGRELLFREHRLWDPLTQLGQAEYLKQQLTLLAHQTPLAIVMFDLVDFASFNRRYGHRQGDRLLRQLSELVLLNSRDGDLLCRYAGDRFVLLLPNTHNFDGKRLAQELRRAVACFAFKTDDGSSCFQTLRIGVVMARPGQTPLQQLNSANDALMRDSVKTRAA